MSMWAALAPAKVEDRPAAPRDWLPILLVPILILLALPLVGSFPTWATLTIAGLAMGLIIFLVASGLTLVFGLMDVMNFGHGIFVALDDVYVEGLVHISELGSDYFHYDDARHELQGERTGKRYRLADRVEVQLVRVDLETTKIDFRLLTDERPSGAGNSPSRAGRRKSR
mgnify:CR=1 FL=1